MAEHSISDKELKRLYERLDEMHKEQEAERAQIKELLGLVKRLDEDIHKLVEARGKRPQKNTPAANCASARGKEKPRDRQGGRGTGLSHGLLGYVQVEFMRQNPVLASAKTASKPCGFTDFW